MFCAVTAARAEEKFSFATTPGKLPKDVVPRAYAIRVAPDLEKLTCEGSETIDLEVLRPTRRLVLNAANMEVTLASLAGVPGRAKPLELPPELNAKAETLSFALPQELPAGKYQLALSFRYKLGQQAQGLYYERYDTPSGQKKTLLATQMEPADARRMFPCWDEPVFRATFQLNATLPANFKAVSNLPVTRETPGANGAKEVVFAPSPPMASYLVALIAGDLEEVKGEAEGVQLRVLTTEGKRDSARYALESTKRILAYYNDYFGLKYPLPKLDEVAVPGGFGGAMENWGCIVYNETALLFDPQRSPAATKERVLAVIAHEMAHQWFGDLVTMAWWDNLWLNEGFASWMGTKATDKLNPPWQVWLRAHAAKEHAMTEDARPTTHPVQQPVKTERDAIDAFDAITYQKGQSIIRMIESWLGEEKFRDGIRRYLAAHEYSNTTTADLWAALEESSGEKVADMAQGWTTQPGFPLLNIHRSPLDTGHGEQPLVFAQERFQVGADATSGFDWQIPVALAGLPARADDAPLPHPLPQFVLLKTERISWRPNSNEEENFFKANAGEVGYYRTCYADPVLAAQIRARIARLPPADQLNLLDDAWALTEAAQQPAAGYFDLLDALRGDVNAAVWEGILERLRAIDTLEFGRPGRAGFQQFARNLLQPQLDRIGWEAKADEDALNPVLRDGLIAALGEFGDENVVAEAERRFDEFVKDHDTSALPADLRPAVFTLVGRHADARRFDQLHDLGRRAMRTEDKQLAYRALEGANDPELCKKALALALEPDELPAPAVARQLLPAAFHGEHPDLAWEFVRAHLDALLSRLPSFEINKFFGRILDQSSDAAQADDLEKIAATHPEAAGSKDFAKTVEAIRQRAELKAREVSNIDAWILQRNARNRPVTP
ncbi:MAG: M1 family metallopeptidase [Verrucomicrobia bacterium]|nr:M1 family metallopeptidase [Verrucomicrobiota bacterium]